MISIALLLVRILPVPRFFLGLFSLRLARLTSEIHRRPRRPSVEVRHRDGGHGSRRVHLVARPPVLVLVSWARSAALKRTQRVACLFTPYAFHRDRFPRRVVVVADVVFLLLVSFVIVITRLVPRYRYGVRIAAEPFAAAKQARGLKPRRQCVEAIGLDHVAVAGPATDGFPGFVIHNIYCSQQSRRAKLVTLKS